MKIIEWRMASYSIPLRRVSGSQVQASRREGWVAIARGEGSLVGLGEIAPLPGHSREGPAEARRHAETLRRRLTGMEVARTPAGLETLVQSSFPSGTPPTVAFGFETAIADLSARSQGLPLAHWLDPDARPRVPVNALLSGDRGTIEEEIRRLVPFGYPAFKLKAGVRGTDETVESVARVRDALGDGGGIRIDANRGWDIDQAMEVLSRVKGYGIDYVEEPLIESRLARAADLFAATGVPIALDETVQEGERFERLVREKAIRTVVIKPSRVGGLTRSIGLARRMVGIGKEVVITSLFESGVGIAACLHLAAAIGGSGPISPCGLDTLRYLAHDLIDEGLPIRDGAMAVPDRPGLGVTLREDAVG